MNCLTGKKMPWQQLYFYQTLNKFSIELSLVEMINNQQVIDTFSSEIKKEKAKKKQKMENVFPNTCKTQIK